MYFQVIITIFVIYALYRVIIQFYSKEISRMEFFFWIIFWLSVLTIGVFPSIINYIANIIGVGRGVDVAIYFSILIIFYLIFKIFVRIDKIDKDLTKIVRKVSIMEKTKKDIDAPNNL